jgi:hypothetical protein
MQRHYNRDSSDDEEFEDSWRNDPLDEKTPIGATLRLSILVIGIASFSVRWETARGFTIGRSRNGIRDPEQCESQGREDVKCTRHW